MTRVTLPSLEMRANSTGSAGPSRCQQDLICSDPRHHISEPNPKLQFALAAPNQSNSHLKRFYDAWGVLTAQIMFLGSWWNRSPKPARHAGLPAFPLPFRLPHWFSHLKTDVRRQSMVQSPADRSEE